MTLAEIVFQARKLEKRYGVEGKVAARYVEAGYSVTMLFDTSKGRISFVAKKAGEVIAADVVYGKIRVTSEIVEKLAEKAASINAKPVLILYGGGPELTEEALKAAKEKNVAVKRIRG